MSRTIVTIQPEDKTWLKQQAKLEHISIAELIRRAIHQYRDNRKPITKVSFEALLAQTSGLWTEGDGLHYQDKLRKEWENRE
ncbi:hypothetical protein BH10PSE19_BH10PSE19_04050 [soil metagenome]